MEAGVFLGIDHGGSTTTALVYDPDRGKRGTGSVPMPKRTPQVGWVDHDPNDFLETSIAAARLALDDANVTWKDVQGIGIANQGETSMAWSRASGKSIGPAISWEDRRTSGLCNDLAKGRLDKLVRARTGILLDPYFSASKFKWLVDNLADAKGELEQGTLALGGTDSFVIYQLTKGETHATDAATASRMALFNLRGVHWDSDLLAGFGLSEEAMPQIKPTSGYFGKVCHPDIPASHVRITADAVDAHAALFAHGCWDNTSVKATYGTGAFIETNTGPTPVEPDGRLLVFIAWDLGDQLDYTVEGGVFSVGSAIDWAVKIGFLPSARESATLAASVSDNGGISFVPCFAGLSAPHWVSHARAMISGLGLDSEQGHIARALLDGIAFRCAEVISALNEKLGGNLQEVKADGGPTANAFLMQRQADLLGMPIIVSQEPDMTALGAALMAGIGAGQLTRNEVFSMPRESRIFEPVMGDDERQSLWEDWRTSVKLVLRGSSS